VNGTDWAAVAVAVASAVLVIGLLVALAAVTRTLRALRSTIEELRVQAVPLVTDLRETVGQANAELARVDNLITSAESISTTVDSASRLLYLTFSNPLIKAIAFTSGSARAARRLRGKSS
jgi:uncharacterized protein YoxC